jgi:hypothetical protein
MEMRIFADGRCVRTEGECVIEYDAKGCDFVRKFDCGTSDIDISNGVERLKTLMGAKQDCSGFGWIQA